MEYENNHYASKGVAGTALGIGIGALGLEVLKGGVGNIFGTGSTCNEDHYVNRYEAAQSAKIAELETRNKLLESNIYTDSKIADVYERLSSRIGGVEAQLAQQAVYNATNTATLNCISGQVAQLQALTKVIIPITNVCPEPMKLYNSWTAPTTSTTGA